MDNKGLITKFIHNKEKSYIEPNRKGTPKGEPIGFSREKYKASLYMLFDTKLNNLAEKLNISYGLIRKWRTEPEFKSLIEQHQKEFSQFFLKRIRERIKESRDLYSKFIKKSSINNITKRIPPRLNYDEFQGEKYSYDLISAINEELGKTIKKDDFPLLFEIQDVVSFIMESLSPETAREMRNIGIMNQNENLKILIKLLINAIKKPRIAETEKKYLLSTWAAVERKLG